MHKSLTIASIEVISHPSEYYPCRVWSGDLAPVAATAVVGKGKHRAGRSIEAARPTATRGADAARDLGGGDGGAGWQAARQAHDPVHPHGDLGDDPGLPGVST